MDEDPSPSRRGALVALVFIVVLVAGGLVVAHVLHNASRTEDCLMRGGRNCAPVESGTGR
jgi:hypothetical protein